MPVMAVARFERFFRTAASLDVDKDDLKRYSDFVNQKLYDLLLIGQATARANGRDVIEPWDLPSPKGSRRASTTSGRSTRRSSSTTPVRALAAGLPHLRPAALGAGERSRRAGRRPQRE
jgi:Domain of unknown function (DUF1931)